MAQKATSHEPIIRKCYVFFAYGRSVLTTNQMDSTSVIPSHRNESNFSAYLIHISKKIKGY